MRDKDPISVCPLRWSNVGVIQCASWSPMCSESMCSESCVRSPCVFSTKKPHSHSDYACLLRKPLLGHIPLRLGVFAAQATAGPHYNHSANPLSVLFDFLSDC